MIQASNNRLIFDAYGDPDFPLAIVPASIGPVEHQHCHDFYELVYVRRGGGVHVIDGRPFPMLRGDVYIMHPDDLHGYREPSADSSIINLIFKPELFTAEQWAGLKSLPGLRPFLDPSGQAVAHKLALTPTDAYDVEQRCERLLTEWRERAAGWRITLHACFTDLLVRIGRAALAYG